MARRLSDFGKDVAGATAMIFALIVVSLVILAGLAIDLQRGVGADTRVQAALDAASLAAAKALEDTSVTDAQIINIAETAFQANLITSAADLECEALSVRVDRTSGKVLTNADCGVPTTLANLIQVNRINVQENSSARAAITKLDVAMMLDVSGSMKGDKLRDLQTAASDAVDMLINDRTGDRVRIGFNTYSTSVNAGAYLSQVVDTSRGTPRRSCVSERTGMWAWRDSAPARNRWLGTDAGSCPSSSIEPLTGDAKKLKREIAKFRAEGMTAGHIGVAWAWYLISPEWKDVWPTASRPHDYDEPHTKKAVILMTDGEFNTEYARGQGNSAAQAKKLCRKMRDEGVIVYAVAFEAPWKAKRTLEDCAGGDGRYFEAENGEELKAAYRAIASQLTNLALTE